MESLRYILKACIIAGFIQFQGQHCQAQDQRIADSLAPYLNSNLKGVEKLELLRNLAFNESEDLQLAIDYAEQLIALAEIENNDLYVHRGYLQKGNALIRTGDLNDALDAFFKSAEACIKTNYYAGEGIGYKSIADVYSEMGNSKNAEIYYDKAIQLLRKTTDTISLAMTLLNAGDEAFNNKKYDASLAYLEESGPLFKGANYLIGIAYNQGNIGMVYAEQDKDDLAEKNITEAVEILEKLGAHSAISVYLTYMSDIYMKKNDISTALDYAKRSLDLAQRNGLKKQIGESNLKLSELYEKSGDIGQSLAHFKDHITYRDSVINLENVEKLANQRTEYEVSQKQIEVDLVNQKRRNQRIIVYATAIALFLIGLLAIGLFKRNRYVQKTNTIIANEKERSENLLLNILPEETAQELKDKGKVQAKKFDSATVLFTDFKGFTHFAENLPPEKLVDSVDFYFSSFDDIMEKHGLEKIKTVGDAYMCAAGLHHPKAGHAKRMVKAAFEIIDFVKKAKKQHSNDSPRFDIRIGINTGPVVAGVVGTKKFAYDIWGDAVNVASRMESNSEPGKINISENTYAIIKDDFDCEYRGKIDVKNRGQMKMYFVNSINKA